MSAPTPPDRRIDYKVWAATGVAALWAAVDTVTDAVGANPALLDGPVWMKWVIALAVFAAGYAKKSQRTP